jgi:uroporphyrin-III C-methyltransferase/precorrin-2 dehydrogenase/sirohydrochlorin ferrochelatase
MDVLPVALKLRGQRCLLIGGGAIARRKARLLRDAGAVLDVLSPEILPELQADVTATGGQYLAERYPCSVDLRIYRVVIAATDDAAVNAQVFEDCEALNVLVNSVDDPPHCRFIVPAIIDRSPLLVSISTNGAAPVLARQLRTKLEALIPAQYGELAKFSGDWRAQVKQAIPVPDTRRIFWENLYAGSVGEQLLNGQREAADQAMPALLADWQTPKGEVYLVGAGTGDPDLLTFKALRLMQQADVVVYDRLVSAPIMNLVRRDAERIYVGKARSDHAVPQEGINALLVRLAQEGKRVCRLKGGDPFIFGRGGEEIEELFAAGVPFQVVPGITAAAGCGAYAGIPLTHRDYAQSVRFLTGHLKAGSPELPWQELIYERQTLVLYMGLVGLERITQQLIAHGLRPDMPVALISKGTTPEQQVVVGTVADIASKVEGSKIVPPTITIIGEVVKLRDKLRWFD